MRHSLSKILVWAGGIVLTSGSLGVAEPQQAETASVTVGGKKIAFPAPQGYVRCDGLNAEWDAATTAVLPASNRRLVAFATPEEAAAIRDNQATGAVRNFNSQIVRNLENQEIGDRTFEQVRSGARAELEKMKTQLDEEIKRLVQEGNQRLNDQLGLDAALSISDSAILGFFEDTPTSLGFTMAMNVSLANELGAKPEKWVVAAVMTPVHGRLINLYANSPFKGEEDRKWVEQAAASWRDAVVAANPRVAGPIAGGFDIAGTIRSGLIGGVLGGIVGGVLWLFKKVAKRDGKE